MTDLVPPASAPAATPERRFRCTACGGEFDEIEVTCPAGQYHCGPCVPIIEHPPAATPEADVRCTECGGVITANEASLAERIHRPCKMLRDQRPTAEEADVATELRDWLKEHGTRPHTTLSARQMVMLFRACDALTAQATELAALRARVGELDALLRRVLGWYHYGAEWWAAIEADIRAALAPRQTTGDEL